MTKKKIKRPAESKQPLASRGSRSCVCGAPAVTVLLYTLPVCQKCYDNDINWGVRPTTLERVFGKGKPHAEARGKPK